MNKKKFIYRKLVRGFVWYSDCRKTKFEVRRIIFTRQQLNKKCSMCKFSGCRHYDIAVHGKVISLYEFCSRDRILNNGKSGRYVLTKIERC